MELIEKRLRVKNIAPNDTKAARTWREAVRHVRARLRELNTWTKLADNLEITYRYPRHIKLNIFTTKILS